MKLDGKQQRQLREALLSAFSTSKELDRMVRDKLNENLWTIAGEGNLEDIVFELMRWLTDRGRLKELLDGALEERPGNDYLVGFAASVGITLPDPNATDVPVQTPPDQSGRSDQDDHHDQPRHADQDDHQNFVTLADEDKTLPITKNILIATVGEHPAVVSAMYDKLTKRKYIRIDEVVLFYPEGLERAYILIHDELPELVAQERLRPEQLKFTDVNSKQSAHIFLSKLYRLLVDIETRGDKAYLSLAGGRKSMAALMAWVVPFFPCIQKLYHILDPKEEFKHVDDLFLRSTNDDIKKAMHPDVDDLLLVDIPIERGLQVRPELRKALLTATNTQLEKLRFMEDLVQKSTFAQEDKVLKVQITQRVAEQLHALQSSNAYLARDVRNFLDNIAFTSKLLSIQIIGSCPYKIPKKDKVHLHLGQAGAKARFVFHTYSKEDIYNGTGAADQLERIAICELDFEIDGYYRTLKEITGSSTFSTVEKYRLNEMPPVLYTFPAESVLIVPLGKYPMVATQLYTLLTKQEQRTIREVILVYPERSTDIKASAEIAKKALWRSAGVPCTLAPIPNLEDIASTENCKDYQQKLENMIDYAQTKYPECKIDLALSGGRKGMTAMTIFAAQKKKIDFVYHTLITDDELEQRIERETEIKVLNRPGLREEERNNRLFLRTYEGGGPYAKFVLFGVPVFAPDAQ